MKILDLGINTPEKAYVYGFLWADGWLTKFKGINYSVAIRLQKEDFLQIKPFLNISGIGNWKFYDYKSKSEKPSWKKMLQAMIHNKILCDTLISNDFDKKSFIAPSTMLSQIPESLKHYWWRGYCDGDGCFYVRKNTASGHCFSLSSTIDQDWSEISKLIHSLGIKSARYTKSISNKKNGKINSYSSYSISKSEDIIKLGEYIYSDYNIYRIGLTRKYIKYQDIKRQFILTKYNKDNKYNKILICPEGKEYLMKNIKNFCRLHNLREDSIRRLISGKILQHAGWRLSTTTKNTLLQSKQSRINAISKTYKVFKGNKPLTIINLSEFCRNNNFSRNSFKALISGKMKKYKNFTLNKG